MPPIEIVIAENERLRAEVAVMRGQIAWLNKQLFGGGKSERFDPGQLGLGLEEPAKAPEADAAATGTVTYERRAPRTKPTEAPAERFRDLPVKETVVIEPPEVQAEPEAFERIGQEETFEVDVVPPQLFKRLIVRPKYRRKDDRSHPPVVAPAPARPIEGGYASAGLLAWIVLGKYVDHQPLYRQEKMSARWGAALSRKTMADWVETVAFWLKPLYNHMRRDLLEGGYVQADETPVRYCDPDQKKGKTGQGWLWAISRPGGEVVFDWRLSRQHGELTKLLQDYEGRLQSDAYGAYKDFARGGNVRWFGCWAHARRKFFESLKEDPRAAGLVLKLIGRLYAMEAQYREANLDPPERGARRRRDHPRILKWLRITIRICAGRALPRSGLGKACEYTLGYWGELTAYAQDGVVEIDNNLMENAIRPSALGKKNFLFIGHPQAGERSAIIYSIVVSCQRHGVDPLAYLRDVLKRLPAMHRQQDLAPLCPRNWKSLQGA